MIHTHPPNLCEYRILRESASSEGVSRGWAGYEMTCFVMKRERQIGEVTRKRIGLMLIVAMSFVQLGVGCESRILWGACLEYDIHVGILLAVNFEGLVGESMRCCQYLHLLSTNLRYA